jgi:hypothetical protein
MTWEFVSQIPRARSSRRWPTGHPVAMPLTRTDPFHQPKCRIRRAKQHLASLDGEIRKFLRSDPYEVSIDPHPEGVGERQWEIAFRPVPDICNDLAFEAVFTLRAALDQAAYASAVAFGVENPRYAPFPIDGTLKDFNGKIDGRGCRDLPDEIKTLFRTLQPFKGGNDSLWALNRLRNAVHTALIPVDIEWASFTISYSGGYETAHRDVRWERSKNKIIFTRRSTGHKSHYDVKVTPVIGFDQAAPASSEPAIAFLDIATRAVENVVKLTEETCRVHGAVQS